MSDAATLISRAREIRQRLRRPANAVFDDGINLKRKKIFQRPKPPAPAPVAIADYVPAPILIRSTITVGAIIRAVAKYYGDVSVKEIKGQKRKAPMVRARHMVFYLASTHCKLSTTHIGLVSGGRDHSTVIHGRDSIRDRIAANDPETTKAVLALEGILYAGLDHHRSSVPTFDQQNVPVPQWAGVQEQELSPVAEGCPPTLAHAEAESLPEAHSGSIQAGGDFIPPEQPAPGPR